MHQVNSGDLSIHFSLMEAKHAILVPIELVEHHCVYFFPSD
jgi:hypothetical protein